MQSLATNLIQKYSLYSKDIVEIGCGKGDFLSLLCKLGNNRGVGIDPLSDNQRIGREIANRLTFIQGYYSEEHGRYHSDLLVCRDTLEHVQLPAKFINTVRRTIGNSLSTVVFFEVPNVTYILRELAFWDIYYEHCTYFSAASLAQLFHHCGFEVTDLDAAYDGQCLLIEAMPGEMPSNTIFESEQGIEQIARDINYFMSRISDKFGQWKQFILEQHNQGKRIVIWGSGSKCVSFLTILGIENKIEYVVDINPNRQGKFLPGSGIEIMPPDFIREYKPDLVIVMNSVYSHEIRQMLDKMGAVTDVISV
jgi:hypothetical protein